MVIHYPPARLRHNSDRPTAITDVLVATSGSSHHTGKIPLGTATCSARTRHGRWALHPSADHVVVVWPGGALTGLPGQVAGELDRLGGDGHDDLDRDAVWAIRQFLTDPTAADAAPWSSDRVRTWSIPAIGYWISGHEPVRPPHPPVSQPARRTNTGPGDSAPQPAADTSTSRLTRSPTRKPACATSTPGATPRVTRRRTAALADRSVHAEPRTEPTDILAATGIGEDPTPPPMSSQSLR
jgi:hypothetical protein